MSQTSIESEFKHQKKHFIFVIDAFTKGGAQRNLELVLPEMVKLGASIDLVLLQTSDQELDLLPLLTSGIRVHRINARNMRDFRGFYRFLKVIRKKDSVLIANLFWSQIWSALLNTLGNLQDIYWVEHNVYLNRSRSQWFIYQLLTHKIISILAVSEEISDFLQNRIKLPVRIIKNAAISSYARNDTSRDFPQFLFVGRLVEQKNPILALEAFKYALNNSLIPKNSKLSLIGDGPLSREIRILIETYSLKANIETLGFLERKEISKFMSESQTLVMTSHHEGSPLVRLEALTHGMAIVTTHTAGIRGILTTNSNEDLLPGIFVTDWSVISIAENLGNSIKPSVWLDESVNVRLNAGKKFSPTKVAREYLNLGEIYKPISLA